MRNSRAVQSTIVVLVVFVLGHAAAHAAFIVEFTDGRKLIVANYQESGAQIKVYTHTGSFAFQKEDIVRIVDIGQKPAPPPAPPTTDRAQPAERHEEFVHAPSPVITPQAAARDAIPPLPGWTDMFNLVAAGVYRGRFLIGLFAGFKLLQFFFPPSFH